MTKRAAAKYKIDRRMGENIWGCPKSPVNKREYGPGQHGQRRKGKLSDFGTQLKAKQKLKGYYANISEKQFRAVYDEASRLKGDTSENLIGLLERRLDTVVYRAKFVATPFAARQFVNHGHIRVNGKRVTIPSYRLRAGDVIEVKDKSKELGAVLEAIQLAERDVPDYVEVDHKKMTAKLSRIPGLSDVPYPVHMEPHQVAEFYSRQASVVPPPCRADEPQLGGRDQAFMHDAHGVQRPVEIARPEVQESDEPREARRDIVILPDEGLQQVPIIRHAIHDLGGGE